MRCTLVNRQAAQGHAQEVAPASKFGQGRRKGMSAVYLYVAVGADDEKPGTLQIAGQVREEVERATATHQLRNDVGLALLLTQVMDGDDETVVTQAAQV